MAITAAVEHRTGSVTWERLSNPPGGLVIWLFIIVELLTFGGAFIFYLISRAGSVEAFNASQALLNRNLAAVNTVVLVTSGFVVAQGVLEYKQGRLQATARRFFAGAGIGMIFLVLKTVEYREKLAAGNDLGASEFFTYYWMLTGFHFAHVVMGVLILLAIALKLRTGRDFKPDDAGVEMGAAFWHLCDLIWVVLFPLIYVLH